MPTARITIREYGQTGDFSSILFCTPFKQTRVVARLFPRTLPAIGSRTAKKEGGKGGGSMAPVKNAPCLRGRRMEDGKAIVSVRVTETEA